MAHNIDMEFINIVNENFWDLLNDDQGIPSDTTDLIGESPPPQISEGRIEYEIAGHEQRYRADYWCRFRVNGKWFSLSSRTSKKYAEEDMENIKAALNQINQ